MRTRAVKTSLVAYIDILGFADRVMAIQDIDDLRARENDLRLIQREFALRPSDKFERKERRLSGKKVFAFSDCIVSSIPLAQGIADPDDTFDDLMMELDWIGLSQGVCALRGVFLRGGIHIGSWSYAKDIMISPALVRSARLEQTITYPVIAISLATFRHFSKHPHRRHYAKGTDGVDMFFKKVRLDGKTYRYLDYIGICLSDLVEPHEIYAWLDQHRKSIEQAYDKAAVRRVKDKYKWIADRHNEHVRRYGVGFELTMCNLKARVRTSGSRLRSARRLSTRP